MPFNGSGAYALPVSTDYPAIADTEISSEDHNATLEDVAAALGETILRDGQAPFEANQSMGGFRLTNVGDATADTDACPKGQVDDLITAAEFNTALPLQSASTLGQFVKSDGTNALWANVGLTREARTSNTILGLADALKFIDVTTGGFTQTFGAAATLGAVWSCLYRNGSTTDVTLDPNSSETIDGLTSFVMYPGETRLIQCDGTNLFSAVIQGFSKTFTSSGTFTKPPGYNAFGMLLWGAGASGGKGDGSTQAGGGGGGACFSGTIPASAVSTTESVTIGSGGVAVTASVTAGNVGGNSSFGSLITSYGGGASQTTSVGGGGGGLKSAGSSPSGGTPTDLFNGGGTGGNSAAGFASYYGGGGGGGGSTDAAYAGGASIYGGGGGGNAPATTAGAGGASVFGGAGGAGGVATNGTAGSAPGGGGGATKTGTQSGAGARGELRIWGIA